MTQPYVSVIIPVYNDLLRLQRCLDALHAQSYPAKKYEILVVDNGSDPPVAPQVTRYPQVRVLHEARPGSYAARNTGIAAARGEVLAFTDSDCIPAPDWIERGAAKLGSVEHCGLVGGKVELFFHDAQHPTAVELYEKIMYFNQEVYIHRHKFSVTANLFTFRNVVEQVGTFDSHLKSSGDKEWSHRVARAGFPLIYAEEAIVTHPARYTFRQLQRKVLRIAGGAEELRRLPHNTLFQTVDWDALRDFCPPVLTMVQLRRTCQSVGFTQQIGVIGLWFVMKGIALLERLRVRWKGKAHRS